MFGAGHPRQKWIPGDGEIPMIDEHIFLGVRQPPKGWAPPVIS